MDFGLCWEICIEVMLMIEYTWEGFWDVSIIFHKPEIEKEKKSPFIFFACTYILKGYSES